MLNNRKAYLHMIRQAETPLSRSKAQLLMFLAMHESNTGHYQFIPTEGGPLSLVLEDDTIAMLKKGLVVETRTADPSKQLLRVSADAYEEAMLPKDEERQLLDRVLGTYQAKEEEELLRLSITRKPFYGIRLPQEKILLLDKRTQSEIAAMQQTLKESERALYTIGYEKISLDEFILRLLLQGVKTVIDVRETTTSRRREFSKNPLQQALKTARIEYISMPEVGIPSEIRTKILAKGDHQDLLVWYREHVMHTSTSYAEEVATLVSRENTALMCYERDPKECHRSLFAQACKERHPEIPTIIHLRDGDEPPLP